MGTPYASSPSPIKAKRTISSKFPSSSRDICSSIRILSGRNKGRATASTDHRYQGGLPDSPVHRLRTSRPPSLTLLEPVLLEVIGTSDLAETESLREIQMGGDGIERAMSTA